MVEQRLRVALVEPYLGGSHRAWAEGYARHSRHDVTVFGLAPIHWKWRMQGGHVTLLPKIERAAVAEGAFDVVLATSMTDLAGLLGLGRRSLGSARAVYYLHENQLTYPLSPDGEPDLTYAMTNWTSMLAADRVVFNSRFHRDEWFAALPSFLGRFPDHRHTGRIDEVRARSSVVPVGIDLDELGRADRGRIARPLVLWNHRWEYDAAPGEFAEAIIELAGAGLDFDLALAGDRPGSEPTELVELRAELGDRIVHDGRAALDDYRALLGRSDIVVSTARHEFFGVAVTEAIAAGAFPVLPNRLVYPERIPEEFHDVCLYDDGRFSERLAWAITHPAETRRVAHELAPAMRTFDWSVQAPVLDRHLNG